MQLRCGSLSAHADAYEECKCDHIFAFGPTGTAMVPAAQDGSAAVLVGQVPAEPVEAKALSSDRAFVAFTHWSE